MRGLVGLLLIGGGAVGCAPAPGDREPDCDGLTSDKSVQRVLGQKYRPDMSCGDLGTALRDAVTGTTPGQHTLVQARNMRDTILAISEDTEQRREPAVAPALRKPIASALVDYAGDTYEVLSGVNPDYYRREDRAPWRDGPVVRVSADPVDVVRVMRAVSDDPSAYAALRAAHTRVCAARLADVPAKATEGASNGPARDCAVGLGRFDGIADDIPEGERREWRTVVFKHLADTAPKPPAYREDAAEHILGTWQQGFAGTEPGETGFLDDDIVRLTDIWAAGRGENSDSDKVDLLQMDSRDAVSSGAEETEEALKCTRDPEERSCQ